MSESLTPRMHEPTPEQVAPAQPAPPPAEYMAPAPPEPVPPASPAPPPEPPPAEPIASTQPPAAEPPVATGSVRYAEGVTAERADPPPQPAPTAGSLAPSAPATVRSVRQRRAPGPLARLVSLIITVGLAWALTVATSAWLLGLFLSRG